MIRRDADELPPEAPPDDERPGFTLLELMVVTVIIVILAAIVVPNYLAYVTTARNVKATAEIKQFVRDINNYRLRQIKFTFPTPEAADGVRDDALAYASDRGTLFYTNANGSNLVYEMDAQTGDIVGVPFDGLTASGGRLNSGMGYGGGDVPSGIALYFGQPGATLVFTDVDNPVGIFGGIGYGLWGNVGADLDGNNQAWFQGYYPDFGARS